MMNKVLKKSRLLKIPRTLLYTLLRPIGWFVFCFVFPMKVINKGGLQHLKAPYILIANHKNAIDPGILGWLCPHELWCLGKKELVQKPFFSWLLEKQLHMIPVSRHSFDLHAMRACIKTLKEGKVLCVFPEGTRHLEHLMEKVEKGVALLALRQKMDLVPVYIDGKLKPFRINRAVVGEPIRTAECFEDGYTEQNADRLVEMVRERFYKLRDMLPHRDRHADSINPDGGER